MTRKRKSGFIPVFDQLVEEGTAEGAETGMQRWGFHLCFHSPSLPLCILVILPESSFLTQQAPDLQLNFPVRSEISKLFFIMKIDGGRSLCLAETCRVWTKHQVCLTALIMAFPPRGISEVHRHWTRCDISFTWPKLKIQVLMVFGNLNKLENFIHRNHMYWLPVFFCSQMLYHLARTKWFFFLLYILF